jgi:hypothetical protein
VHALPRRVAVIDDVARKQGRATYAATRVVSICFDLARVLGGVASTDMYSDPLGTLINRL